MFFKRKYKYLVFFWNTELEKNGFGFGCAETTLESKIKSFDDINALNEALSKKNNAKCCIINYKLI